MWPIAPSMRIIGRSTALFATLLAVEHARRAPLRPGTASPTSTATCALATRGGSDPAAWRASNAAYTRAAALRSMSGGWVSGNRSCHILRYTDARRPGGSMFATSSRRRMEIATSPMPSRARVGPIRMPISTSGSCGSVSRSGLPTTCRPEPSSRVGSRSTAIRCAPSSPFAENSVGRQPVAERPDPLGAEFHLRPGPQLVRRRIRRTGSARARPRARAAPARTPPRSRGTGSWRCR